MEILFEKGKKKKEKEKKRKREKEKKRKRKKRKKNSETKAHARTFIDVCSASDLHSYVVIPRDLHALSMWCTTYD